ncbi:MAG: adenylyltransferase/cytidyltransferase family protein [Spirochaetaceae bacterium]
MSGRKKSAVIIGRFMPPHNGHRYLVDFARSLADRVFILVCTLPGEPIEGRIRYAWMKELFPDLDVVHITEEIPEASRENPGAPSIWARSIRRKTGHKIDYVIASEDYGFHLARELDAEFVPLDPARHLVPISASVIRENPYRHWRYLPDVVKPYFVKRIAIVDEGEIRDETFVAELADRFDTSYVRSYLSFWETYNERTPEDAELDLIIRSHFASEDALIRQANRVIFCGPTPLELVVRLRREQREIPPGLIKAFEERPYDFYFLLRRKQHGDTVVCDTEYLLKRNALPFVTLKEPMEAAVEQVEQQVRRMLRLDPVTAPAEARTGS